MKNTRIYLTTKFNPETIALAEKTLVKKLPREHKKNTSSYLTIDIQDNNSWQHDNDTEFFSDYRKNCKFAHFSKSFSHGKGSLELNFRGNTSEIGIGAPQRQTIEEVFEIFEQAKKSSIYKENTPPVEPPTIFIGHGQNEQWRKLKDHLADQHNYKIDAYEVGSRTGHAVRDVLERMVQGASFAILVMTGEDKLEDGSLLARQNVIHEMGLFQGKLGFSKAIVLIEKDTKIPSNIQGITYVQFATGNIRETFGDVLAVLKREFN